MLNRTINLERLNGGCFIVAKGRGIGLRMQEGRKGGTEKKIKKAQFVENQERQTLVLKSAAFFTIIFFQSSC
jgi:hypothetical protein